MSGLQKQKRKLVTIFFFTIGTIKHVGLSSPAFGVGKQGLMEHLVLVSGKLEVCQFETINPYTANRAAVAQCQQAGLRVMAASPFTMDNATILNNLRHEPILNLIAEVHEKSVAVKSYTSKYNRERISGYDFVLCPNSK